MRLTLALPLLLVAACSVDSDAANDQVTLEFNQELVEGTAEELGNAAEEVGSSVGNVADSTAQAISNEVGDIDVDLDVNRNRTGNSN